MTPYTIKNKFGTGGVGLPQVHQSVPCGKCPACLKRRTSQWSFRLMQEEKRSQSAQFITLTYGTENVVITPSGFLSLDKRDVQLFFKRLRKAHDVSGSTLPPIKYYAVGEYGGKTKRPHYHAILFNAKIELIQKAWDKGQVHYGTVTGASIGYTLKYICKKATVPAHKNDDRLPEFCLMSKGLGENYLTDAMKDWHLSDKNERMYVNIPGGKKAAMPRYYKDRVYDEDTRKQIGIKQRMKMIDEDNKKRQDENYGQNIEDKIYDDKAAFEKMEIDSRKNEKL